MQPSSQSKALNNVSLWWAAWLGLVLVTFSQVLDESLINSSLGTNLLLIFLMSLYFLPMKMLCVIGRDLFPIFFSLFEKLILPISSISLPFYWGLMSFGPGGAEGNLLYGISLGENKLIFLIPLFILMRDPRNFLAKNISVAVDLSDAKKHFIFYFILCHWVWLFPVL